jgi:hypothetical protein
MDRPGKKTAAAIHQEITEEVNQLLAVIFAERRKSGRLDLEAVEMGLRAALHRGGSACLTQLLQQPAPEDRSLPCPCGAQARYREMRSKSILTAVGSATVLRPYYHCPSCHQGQFPADQVLDVEGTEFSPGVRRMLAVVGSDSCSFQQGRQQMELLAGLAVTAKAVERVAEAIGADIAQREQAQQPQAVQLELPAAVGQSVPVMYVEMDGTGVPMVSKETEGRVGKPAGSQPRTREVKLGCVFTQTTQDDKGHAVRDEQSTTYTAAIESAAEFSRRIYHEAAQRGWSRAQRQVVIGDGAEWIWNLVGEQFPGAIEIVDLFHARQHLWDLAAKLYPNDDAQKRRWVLKHQHLLDEGQIEKLVGVLWGLSRDHSALEPTLQTEANYFQRNAERMRYPQFRRQGLFVGSGVVEAGCKTVIATRLKRSGMFWTRRGANAIIALRCCRLSGKFEDYWETRRA